MNDSDFQDFGPPPAVLYRYRPSSEVERGYFEDMVVNNRIWATSPTRFNDPSDCKVRFDFAGTDAEWREFLKGQIARHEAHFPALAAAYPWPPIESRFWVNPAFQEGVAGELQSNVDGTGVVSTCENPQIPLMWAHYATGHTGICLRFGTSHAPFSECLRVHYQPTVPSVRFDAGGAAIVKASLLTKAEWWRYEAEWRFVGFKRGEGFRQFHPSALEAVIVGAKAERNLVEHVRELCGRHDPVVEVLRAEVRSDSYEMQILPLKWHAA